MKADLVFSCTNTMTTLFKVIHKQISSKVRGHDDTKIRYDIETDNGNKYIAFTWDLLEGKPIVYDAEFDEVLNNSWSITTSGYSWNKEVGYMHSIIAKKCNLVLRYNESIDHINGYKLDNRKVNLRVATQSEQNSNRGTRSDKIKPADELIEIGVEELPRYVRWDKGEGKFVIEKHPYLIQEVNEGKKKKAAMSGTKSKSIGIVEKYKDILARLKELDDNLLDDGFKEKRNKLKQEYEAICQAINDFNNTTNDIMSHDMQLPQEKQENTINAERRTAKNKKTTSKLPEDCGVKPEDIPKYCYYQAASDKRGDKFTIDKHPALIKQGKRQWSTSEKITMTTLDKFKQMMDKYNELEKDL